MRREILAFAALCATATPARADGWFYEESFGLSSARANVPSLSTALRLRLGVGWRTGQLSFEPFAAGDLTFDRVGATFDILGGDPAPGDADFVQLGFDAKYTQPIGSHVALYVRGGPRVGDGQGSLSGYYGPGLGGGAGIQVTGRVRALGFLWAPLFFLHRGPKLTGALFLDQSADVYWLSSRRATLGVPFVATNIGFAFGADF